MTQKYLLKDSRFIPVKYIGETEKSISFENTNTNEKFKVYKTTNFEILSFDLTAVIKEKLNPENLENLMGECLKENKFWIFRFDPYTKIFQYRYSLSSSSIEYDLKDSTIFKKLENKNILNSKEVSILNQYVDNFKSNSYSKLYRDNLAAAIEIFKVNHPECFKVKVYDYNEVYYLNLNIANEFVLGPNYSICCEKRRGIIYLVDYHDAYANKKLQILATKENLAALAISSLKILKDAEFNYCKILFKFNNALLYIDNNGETRFTNFFAKNYIPNEDLLNNAENKDNLIKFKGLQNSGLIDKDFVVENVSYNIKKEAFVLRKNSSYADPLRLFLRCINSVYKEEFIEQLGEDNFAIIKLMETVRK